MRWHLGILCLVACALTTPARAAEDVVKGLYDNAILLLRQGRPDEALKDLERIYKSYPNSEYADEALYRLGVYHLENKQYQAALESFNQLISTFGDRNSAPEAYYSVGEIYANVAFPGFDFEKADANFARVYNIYGRSERVDDALLRSGLIKARLQEFGNARATLQRLVDEYPQSNMAPRALYHLGLTLVNLDEPIPALGVLQRVVDEYDDEPMKLRALRVTNNLYRTQVLMKKPGAAPYKPDAAFSNKKFKDVTVLEVDFEDNLYVATKDGGVRVFGFDGTEKPPIANQRDVRGLFADESGEVYLVKKGSAYFGGQDRAFRRKAAKGLEPLTDLQGLVRNAARDFLVLTSDRGNLVRFDKDENHVGEFPSFKVSEVADMAMDPRGNLYLIDGKLERLLRINAAGSNTGGIDKKGERHAMKKMSQVAIDAAGTIYVLDDKEKQVHLFGPDLKHVTSFTPPGISKPELIAVDSAGTLYIYDSKEGVIRKYI